MSMFCLIINLLIISKEKFIIIICFLDVFKWLNGGQLWLKLIIQKFTVFNHPFPASFQLLLITEDGFKEMLNN